MKELCDKARINKKTFYHYYETLDFLLAELQAELSSGYMERVKDFKLPEELDKVNREFFLYSAAQGLAYEKITCSGAYHSIREEMVESVNDAGWSRSEKYQSLSEYEKKLLMALGLCARAGSITVGVPMVCDAMRRGGSKAPATVFLADGVAENSRKRITDRCSFYGVRLVELSCDAGTLAAAVGKTSIVACVAVPDGQLLRLTEKYLGEAEATSPQSQEK